MGVKRSVSIAGVLLSVVMFGVWSVQASGQAAPAKKTAPAAAAAPAAKPVGPVKQAKLPPLPFGPKDPLPRPNQVVAAVFVFAAEHPEILNYVPCFCGCDHMGHKGNTDCFVKSRAANGRILEWDTHGLGCAVCLDVGRKAMTMFNQGMSVSDIRASIEREYAGRTSAHTPTPLPPKTGGKS